MLVRVLRKTWLPCIVLMACTGCSRAPSIEVIGSFFPAWMFCIIAALVMTGFVRVLLVRRQLEQKLGPLIVLYPSVCVAITCLLWLILFG